VIKEGAEQYLAHSYIISKSIMNHGRFIMNSEQCDGLNDISRKLWQCRECSFHERLKGIPYKPEILSFKNDNDNEYKVLSVGINSGWDDNQYKDYWEAVYTENDFEEYKKLITKTWDQIRKAKNPVQHYRDGIFKYFDIINKKLHIYDEGLVTKDNFYDYIFWSNLSFCCSQNIYTRKFDGKDIGCDVYNEEIPNCLSKGYLRDVIKLLNPKLIMFFGYEAVNFFNFMKIFDTVKSTDVKVYDKTRFKAHERDVKTGKISIDTTIIACKIHTDDKKTSILFLPHPNYRFTDDNKTEALGKVCDWLKN
jgi:uracil-DNA glycosylase